MKKYITTFLVIVMGIAIVILTMINQKNKEILNKCVKESKNNSSVSTNIDSIVFENLTKDIIISRYEYILDRAKEEMSEECKNKLDSIFIQTE